MRTLILSQFPQQVQLLPALKAYRSAGLDPVILSDLSLAQETIEKGNFDVLVIERTCSQSLTPIYLQNLVLAAKTKNPSLEVFTHGFKNLKLSKLYSGMDYSSIFYDEWVSTLSQLRRSVKKQAS